jgi:hypothetical protein
MRERVHQQERARTPAALALAASGYEYSMCATGRRLIRCEAALAAVGKRLVVNVIDAEPKRMARFGAAPGRRKTKRARSMAAHYNPHGQNSGSSLAWNREQSKRDRIFGAAGVERYFGLSSTSGFEICGICSGTRFCPIQDPEFDVCRSSGAR